MQERLQKVLAEAGVASRRAAEKLIEAGRVSVNGEVVTQLGTKVDPEKDRLQVDGRVVQPAQERIYILMNKPRGYVSSVRDPEGRKTVLDLIGPIGLRLYPVGRLDMDTEGLLLLTNDGDLTNALLHPRHEVPKTYIAEVEGSPSGGALAALAKGIRLEDGMTAPAEVKVIGHNERGGTTLSLTIHEGRNRQVRRMLEAVGHRVYFLKRTRFGPLDLRGLTLGKYRYLTSAEVDMLSSATGGARSSRSMRRRVRPAADSNAPAPAGGLKARRAAPAAAATRGPGSARTATAGPRRFGSPGKATPTGAQKRDSWRPTEGLTRSRSKGSRRGTTQGK